MLAAYVCVASGKNIRVKMFLLLLLFSVAAAVGVVGAVGLHAEGCKMQENV